jgi:hypothetical protein
MLLIERPTPEAVSAIRRLNIEWALQNYPFPAIKSPDNGKWYSADENALVTLHVGRIIYGSKSERRASEQWLRKEGLLNLARQAKCLRH